MLLQYRRLSLLLPSSQDLQGSPLLFAGWPLGGADRPLANCEALLKACGASSPLGNRSTSPLRSALSQASTTCATLSDCSASFGTDSGKSSWLDGSPVMTSSSPSIISASDDGNEVVLKSAGSALHPDRCIECHFHFFKTGGCRDGADCKYCHEVHPRSNAKKMRKMQRRVAVKEAGIHGKMTLEYVPRPCAESTPATVTLLVGHQANLVPSIDIVGIGPAPPKAIDKLSFEVQPPLPPGLVVCPKTGTLCGMPSLACSREWYQITASAQVDSEMESLGSKVKVAVARLWLAVADQHSSLTKVEASCPPPGLESSSSPQGSGPWGETAP